VIVGPLVPPGVLPVAIAAVAACLTTRWVGPKVLRALAKGLQTAVAVIAAVMILPEYWITTASRSRHRCPSQLAYNYGAAIGRVTLLLHWIIGLLLYGSANTLRAIPVPLVAIAAGGLTVGWLLDLITI
jgi:hypothetical protein